jgi:hypothetical protein
MNRLSSVSKKSGAVHAVRDAGWPGSNFGQCVSSMHLAKLLEAPRTESAPAPVSVRVDQQQPASHLGVAHRLGMLVGKCISRWRKMPRPS